MIRSRGSAQSRNSKHPPKSLLPQIMQEVDDGLKTTFDDYNDKLYLPEYRGLMKESEFTKYLRTQKRKDEGFKTIKCIQGCSYFSFVGMIFLIFIGVLIDTQPFFIKGIHKSVHNNNSTQKKYVTYKNRQLSQIMYGSIFASARRQLKEVRVLVQKTNAFNAAFAYFCTMLICIIYVRYNEQISIRWAQWKRRIRYGEHTDFSTFSIKESHRHGYGTFELWKRKIQSSTPGIKWYKDEDKSKKR